MHRHGILRELAAFLFFLLAAVALTWPLATHMATAVSDPGDPLLVAWIVDWDCWALTHAPLQLYQAPMYAPAHLALAYSENFIGESLMVLPFHLAGLPPLTVYNIAMILGFALSGYGAYVLAWMITRSMPASLIAGIFAAFVGFKFDHLAHLHIVWSGWLSLLLAALLAYWRTPSIRSAVGLAVAFVMNGLTNVHWFLFGGLAILMTIAFLGVATERRDLRFWLRLGGALAVGMLILLPFLIPYHIVSKEYGMRRWPGEALDGSATWDDWLMATPRNVIYGRVVMDEDRSQHERRLFPGLLPLLLAAAALLMTQPLSSRVPAGQGEEGGPGVPQTGSPQEPRPSAGPSASLRPASGPPAAEGVGKTIQPSPANRRWLRALDAAMVILAIAAYVGAAAHKFLVAWHGTTLIGLDSSDGPAMLFVVALTIRCSIAIPAALGGGTIRSRLRAALARSRFSPEAWAAALWVVIGFVGSFGMRFFFHEFLFRRIPIYQSIRIPARWAVVAYTGLSVWAALGVVALLANRPKVWKQLLVSLLFALALLDVLTRIRWDYGAPATATAAVYHWLDQSRTAIHGSVLELPMSNYGVQYYYLLGATEHHVPIMNGISGFEPPVHGQLREAGEQHRFDDAYLEALERNGCALIVVHTDWLRDQTPKLKEWLRRQVQRRRIAFVRRFDQAVYGDYVFAVTKNERHWPSLRGNDAIDGAGHIPDENLLRFFAGQPTYNASTFGRIDQPIQDNSYTRQLSVTGWALSPYGIRSATVLIHGGKVRVPAALTPRGDITSTWPWYPKTPNPAFTAVIPRRPKHIPRETDIQVELVDGRGEVTRLKDVAITWQ